MNEKLNLKETFKGNKDKIKLAEIYLSHMKNFKPVSHMEFADGVINDILCSEYYIKDNESEYIYPEISCVERRDQLREIFVETEKTLFTKGYINPGKGLDPIKGLTDLLSNLGLPPPSNSNPSKF